MVWVGNKKLNWISISIKPKIGRDLNSAKMHFYSKFGNSNFNWWWVMAWTSSEWGKFWLWSSIWPWRSRSVIPQNNRDLNQGLLHLWSKFGDPSLNGWWVIAQTSWGLTHTHGHTHRQTQTTTIPEGQNWPRVKRCDRQKDRQTDRWREWTIHRAAWSQLFKMPGNSINNMAHKIGDSSLATLHEPFNSNGQLYHCIYCTVAWCMHDIKQPLWPY